MVTAGFDVIGENSQALRLRQSFAALALGKDGFSAAISALFRTLEGLRGDDDVELRATRLVMETLSYAASATISTSRLDRNPQKPEAEFIINTLIENAETLAEEQQVKFENDHLTNPASFPLFDDAALRIYFELRQCKPIESEANVAARFRRFISEGLNRIRTRDPEYFSIVIASLSGPDANSDARVRAWDQYRANLIRRFEDEPLFGEDRENGTTLGQVYQPLRAWWEIDIEDPGLGPPGTPAAGSVTKTARKMRRHVRMLDKLILDWLNKDNKSDRIRLVSGGPGSGKSTFAKSLAAQLAREPRWRVIFVPLQRLKGIGPLETRIDEYFRLQLDEPFEAETAPLLSVGRDEHHDWLIIFDGLDELAKEGASSESAAQDFASALADWRGRVGLVAMRFIVLGRAPSMQEARRRLGLQGEGTVYVADMVPFQKEERASTGQQISFDDPGALMDLDQRSEFWGRWAAAKGLSLEPPEAMKVDALRDLTKEPLLAYLLILSGYASERWQEAAENRNRIYQAIFNQIWERERNKPTRIYLNDLGEGGFDSLMQALGLAAWRGGGRTGDEATFTSVRDTFMRPDLVKKAKECGAADLSNVALLFYTRRDEEGGRGYEFLHKSFGEYLTARGLLNAFRRWGAQMEDPTLDFDSTEFLRRWLRLAGPAPMTREILNFLRNEARLEARALDADRPWQPAREWVRIAEFLMDTAIKEGLPAHEGATKWRLAEAQERNAEESLMALLDACARAAYPSSLRNAPPNEGGWEAGPVRIRAFEEGETNFTLFLTRLAQGNFNNWLMSLEYMLIGSDANIYQLISRLSLKGINLAGHTLTGAKLDGANLQGAFFLGTSLAGADLSGADLRNARLRLSNFMRANLSDTDLRKADIRQCNFQGANIETTKADVSLKRMVSRAKKSRGRLEDFTIFPIDKLV